MEQGKVYPMAQCSLCGQAGSSPVGEKQGSVFVKCKECSLIRIEPHPTDQELEVFYQNYVYTERVHNPRKKWLRFRLRVWLLRLLAPGRKFLDIGCNVGSMVSAAHAMGCDAVGIDVGPSAIAHAKKLWPDCRFYNETLEAFTARGEKFDIVFCTEVIEHVRDLHGFMQALTQVLNPHAILFFTTPDSGHFRVSKTDLIAWSELRPTEHLAIFNKANIQQLFKQHGFGSFSFVPMHRANLRFYSRYQPTLK